VKAEDFQGRRVAVLGLGSTGTALVGRLLEMGAEVLAFDESDSAETAETVGRLRERGADARTGQARPSDLAGADLVVASPGVPPHSPSMRSAAEAGVETIGEIELASRLTEGTIVAVSGTNGKTTTTTLAGEMLKRTGRKVVVAGNIGTPFVSEVAPQDADTLYVLEISSFHLAYAPTFRPHVAVLLNVTPDHINWHGSMDAYVQAKAALFANQTADDFAVVNASDGRVREISRGVASRVVPFSTEPLAEGVFVEGGAIVAVLGGRHEEIGDAGRLQIRGAHNLENALAASAAALCAGAYARQIGQVLASFEGVEHRLEKVALVKGVTYWNDSKATNPEAAIKALQSFDEPLIVLLGGRNKGNSFEELAAVAAERARRAYVFGEARDEIAPALEGVNVPFELVETMDEAVRGAAASACEGDNVLLSPACASFDEFDNFEQRGATFKSIVDEMGPR